MNERLWLGLTLWACMLTAIACNGDDTDGSGGACADFTPCGGEVVGTWELVDLCAEDFIGALRSMTMIPDACLDGTQIELRPSGTITFDADMTGNVSAQFIVDSTYVYDQECIDEIVGGGAQVDASLCPNLESNIAMADTVASASCEFGANACECMTSSDPNPIMAGGTYSVVGTAIRDESGDTDFCVDGDTLLARSVDSGVEIIMVFRRQ